MMTISLFSLLLVSVSCAPIKLANVAIPAGASLFLGGHETGAFSVVAPPKSLSSLPSMRSFSPYTALSAAKRTIYDFKYRHEVPLLDGFAYLYINRPKYSEMKAIITHKDALDEVTTEMVCVVF
jgi:hypothetical protein